MDLALSEKPCAETIFFLMSEDNLALWGKQPWIKIGTESVGVNPKGAKDMAHPQSYGMFPADSGRVRPRQDDLGHHAAAGNSGPRLVAA